ncbi:MAG TPA: hypothetical protein VJU83_09470 [Burkholderiales bacterium]|nr:hypothetical protein [Burkholderiales bacterium]
MDLPERVIEAGTAGCSLSALMRLVDGVPKEVGYIVYVNGAVVGEFTSRPAAIAAWKERVDAALARAADQQAPDGQEDEDMDEPSQRPSF